MISPTDAFAIVRRALFRIPIEQDTDGQWWWGTGFFISQDGHALTAFHSLPVLVSAGRRGQVRALDLAGGAFVLDYVPMAGDKDRDVALLRLSKGQRPTHGVSHVA
jgi:hypothetical protein